MNCSLPKGSVFLQYIRLKCQKIKIKKISDRQMISNLIKYIEQSTNVFEFECGASNDGLKFTQHNTNEYSITLPKSRRRLRFLITFE